MKKKIVITSIAGLVMLFLVGCGSAVGPGIEFAEPSPTPTTPTPEPETFTPEPQPDLDLAIDSVHVLTNGKYGSGSTYTLVGEVLQMSCWTLDDARTTVDALNIIFNAGEESGIATKDVAAFIYSSVKYLCPEHKIAVDRWSETNA